MQRPGPQLPSIRQLHPYLPPPPSEYAGSPESGHEHDEHEDRDDEPPKKKRRRQALSCTECKRRKIRCDRTQPCTPCVRRGDQAKCQWHVVEPVIEKYVSRADHDALRARVDALEAYIQRHMPPGLPPFSATGFTPASAGTIAQPGPSAQQGQGFNTSVPPPQRTTSPFSASSPVQRFDPTTSTHTFPPRTFSPPAQHQQTTVTPSQTQTQGFLHSTSHFSSQPHSNLPPDPQRARRSPPRPQTQPQQLSLDTFPPGRSPRRTIPEAEAGRVSRRPSPLPRRIIPLSRRKAATVTLSDPPPPDRAWGPGFGAFPVASGAFPSASAGGMSGSTRHTHTRTSSGSRSGTVGTEPTRSPSGSGSRGAAGHTSFSSLPTSSSSRSEAAQPSSASASSHTSSGHTSLSSFFASSPHPSFSSFSAPGSSPHTSFSSFSASASPDTPHASFSASPRALARRPSLSAISGGSGGGGMLFQPLHVAARVVSPIGLSSKRAEPWARVRGNVAREMEFPTETHTTLFPPSLKAPHSGPAPKNWAAQTLRGPRLRARREPWERGMKLFLLHLVPLPLPARWAGAKRATGAGTPQYFCPRLRMRLRGGLPAGHPMEDALVRARAVVLPAEQEHHPVRASRSTSCTLRPRRADQQRIRLRSPFSPPELSPHAGAHDPRSTYRAGYSYSAPTGTRRAVLLRSPAHDSARQRPPSSPPAPANIDRADEDDEDEDRQA
ncbi:hypothetical protein FB451DRAFT_1461118 [Mycena latifolia]|nr:hypothetical protein FB451DRAFT_1461118 [Mycena latifolia]